MYMRMGAWPKLPETVEAQAIQNFFNFFFEKGLTLALDGGKIVTVKGDRATGFRWLPILDGQHRSRARHRPDVTGCVP